MDQENKKPEVIVLDNYILLDGEFYSITEIKAAPEMFEALELFIEAMDENKNGKKERQRLLGMAISEAEAALAKAKGSK